jgi:uncharacterized phiE125 gp8 family phage protein
MRSVIVTPPAEEPVSLAEAKFHLRIDSTARDDEVSAWITEARAWCEEYCGRAFVTQTRMLVLDEFPDAIALDMPPAASVDSVKYLDATDGTLQTLSSSSYVVDIYNEPGWVQPSNGYSWPATYAEINAVRVQFVCGYGVASSVPAPIKAAIKLLLGDKDAARGNTVIGTLPPGELPLGVRALLAPYRFDLGMA